MLTAGLTHPDNRGGEDFACLNCGYKTHADYDATKNIGLRYLRRNQTGGDEGAPLGVRLNRGTLKLDRGYSPTCRLEQESTLSPTALAVGSSIPTLSVS